MPANPDPASAERRLLRLAGWFLARGEPATRGEIYRAFSRDYRGTPAAMEKKWTRHKDALRRLGVPVHFVEMLDEHGGAYTIDVGSYLLPKLDFAPEEAAILWMAGRAALRKLVVGARGLTPRVASLEADHAPLPGDWPRGWRTTTSAPKRAVD